MPPMMETPPPPSSVTGAMGGGPEKVPFSGVGSMMAGQKSPGAPGGADPTGGFKAAKEAVVKVVDNMATMDKEGAAFASRIKQMFDAWAADFAKRGPAGGGAPGGAPPSAKPEEGAPKDFVG
jgi:hypothetical protein